MKKSIKIELNEQDGTINAEVHASLNDILLMTGTLINSYLHQTCQDTWMPAEFENSAAVVMAKIGEYITASGKPEVISQRELEE